LKKAFASHHHWLANAFSVDFHHLTCITAARRKKEAENALHKNGEGRILVSEA